MQRHLIEYIRCPELLDEQSIAQLQPLTEKYPYFHVARLLMLKAMYRQHHPQFDHELRKAALYLPDRATLNQMMEAEERTRGTHAPEKTSTDTDRTGQLIDNFLNGLPQEPAPRRIHNADATVDYMAYLLQSEENAPTQPEQEVEPMPGQNLIDEFIGNNEGRFVLNEEVETAPAQESDAEVKEDEKNEIFTETLARIYIKQGKFDKAIEIIQRLSLKYPKKNRYFADQIRFLEKLIINNKNK